MKVSAYDPFMNKEQIEGYGAVYYEDYEELLKDSDVVTNPCTAHRADKRYDKKKSSWN